MLCTDHWRKEALRVVEEHPVQDPLYLYYAFQDCHSPQEAPQDFTEMYSQLTASCSCSKLLSTASSCCLPSLALALDLELDPCLPCRCVDT